MDSELIVHEDGSQYWKNKAGDFHRLDGPAVIWANGDQSWYQNNKLHRENGPAINWMSYKKWYRNDRLHRVNGPAIIWPDGTQEWWLKGEFIKHLPPSAKLNWKKYGF